MKPAPSLQRADPVLTLPNVLCASLAYFIHLSFSQLNCSGDLSAWSCNASAGVELRSFQPNQTAAFGGNACPVSPEFRPCRDNSGCTSNVSYEERGVRILSSSFSRDVVILQMLETTNCTWGPDYSYGARLDCSFRGFTTVPVGIPSTRKIL